MRPNAFPPPPARRSHHRVAALSAPLLIALAVPAVLVTAGTSADAKTSPPASRVSYAPNVMYPVARGTKGVSDRNLYRAGRYNATQIQAPCGARVVAAHAGTVSFSALNPTSRTRYLWVTTTKGRSMSTYTVAGTPTAAQGQVVSPGQTLGTVGNMGGTRACETLFAIRSQYGNIMNPTGWLNVMVGKAMVETTYFGNRGFNLASFNMLGASHTDNGGSRYGSAASRTPKAVALLNKKTVDVAGLQELQGKQYDQLMSLAGSTFASYTTNRTYGDRPRDTENTLIWRRSSFKLLAAGQLAIPYFNGNTRMIPVVRLQQISSGRSAYFINTHNPANTGEYPRQEKWRAQAIAIERKKIIELRATGLPVFLTGDLNDRTAAFCPLTAGKLMLSPDSVPSTTCAPPKSPWIDWILGAGPTRFTTYDRDWSAKTQGITDHPIIVARTYLATPG